MAAAFPAGLALATVTAGPVLATDGSPVAGVTIVLVPEWELIHAATGTRILPGGASMVTGTDGTASTQVVRSDAAGLTRPNVTYQVVWSGPASAGVLPKPFPLYVGSPTVDLEQAQPTSGSAGVAVQPTVSVAGLVGAITAAGLADALVAELAPHLSNPTDPLGAAGRAAFRSRSAGIQAFAAKLAGQQDALVIANAGDSTSDETSEWFRRMCNDLLAARPWIAAAYHSWLGDSYADSVAQAATPAQSATRVSWDNFERTAAELVGSTPVRGPAWFGATGIWSLAGGAATAIGSDQYAAATLSSTLSGASSKLIASLTMDTTTASKTVGLAVGKDSSNRVFLYVTAASGSVTASLLKQVAGVGAAVGSSTAVTVPGGAASTFDATLSVSGTSVVARVGGTTLTATLSSADAASVAGSTAFMLVYGTTAGTKVNDLTVDVFANETTQAMDIYNGAKAGSTLQYQQDRLTALYPVAPDVLFVSSSHNYGTMTTAAYLAALDAFIAAVRAVYPDVFFVLSSQNPETQPVAAVTRAAHAARCAAMRRYARLNGHGYVAAFEAFVASGDPRLIRPDGVHPTAVAVVDALTDPINGQYVWKQAAVAYLASEGITT